MVWYTAWKIVSVGVGFTQASICLLLQGLLPKLDLSLASLPGHGLSLTFNHPWKPAFREPASACTFLCLSMRPCWAHWIFSLCWAGA